MEKISMVAQPTTVYVCDCCGHECGMKETVYAITMRAFPADDRIVAVGQTTMAAAAFNIGEAFRQTRHVCSECITPIQKLFDNEMRV